MPAPPAAALRARAACGLRDSRVMTWRRPLGWRCSGSILRERRPARGPSGRRRVSGAPGVHEPSTEASAACTSDVALCTPPVYPERDTGSSDMAKTAAGPAWKREDDARITLSGSWNLLVDKQRRRRLFREFRRLGSPRDYCWDLQQIDVLDSTGALVLWKVWNRELPDRLDCSEE